MQVSISPTFHDHSIKKTRTCFTFKKKTNCFARTFPSGASSKDAPRGVQVAPYSLEIAGSNPGYITADHDRGFLGGSAQLAECRPGREGLDRRGTPVADRVPAVLQWSHQICVVLRHYRSGGLAVDLQCEK